MGVANSWPQSTIETEESQSSMINNYLTSTYNTNYSVESGPFMYGQDTSGASKYDPIDRLCPEMWKHKIIRIIGKGKLEKSHRACKVCSAAKIRNSTAFMCILDVLKNMILKGNINFNKIVMLSLK